MRAVVIHAPKDLRIDSFPDAAPGPGQVRVKIANGGICGSDLHYYHHGGFGTVRIQHPMALGHEIAGVVAAVGDGVTDVTEGMRVAVNPSLPCGHCRYCREGLRNQCLDMRFLGSAMRNPHVHGGFREYITVDASQAVPISSSLSLAEAAMAEPLSVCLHAAHQAGPLLGKRVLVTGCGPIGALTVATLKAAGAAWITATDLIEGPLAKAKAVGSDEAIDVGNDAAALDRYRARRGWFDVAIEASGSVAGLQTCLECVRAGGVVVQLGNIPGSAWSLVLQALMTKELDLRGSFRFNRVFEQALSALAERRIVVDPLLSARFPLADARDAFELALDRGRSMKVQLFADA
jgi:L-idonate 5-dehydrogenase